MRWLLLWQVCQSAPAQVWPQVLSDDALSTGLLLRYQSSGASHLHMLQFTAGLLWPSCNFPLLSDPLLSGQCLLLLLPSSRVLAPWALRLYWPGPPDLSRVSRIVHADADWGRALGLHWAKALIWAPAWWLGSWCCSSLRLHNMLQCPHRLLRAEASESLPWGKRRITCHH